MKFLLSIVFLSLQLTYFSATLVAVIVLAQEVLHKVCLLRLKPIPDDNVIVKKSNQVHLLNLLDKECYPLGQKILEKNRCRCNCSYCNDVSTTNHTYSTCSVD